MSTDVHRAARILLLLPTQTYRAPDFLKAARRLGVEVTVASEEKNVLESQNPAGYLELDFEDLERCSRVVRAFSKKYPLDAVLGMDDSTMVAAAAISRVLGLKSNSVASVQACRDKHLMRKRLQRQGLPIPAFRLFSITADPYEVSSKVPYPCVLKPTRLSASQGVIRTDDPDNFVRAWKRLKKIIKSVKTSPEVLVEEFTPGKEVALEGIIEDGRLRVLALFDKPDPLDGPFFEETIYLRPSQLSARIQKQVHACASQAVRALSLCTGPVHAELRVSEHGPVIIEVAARPIGGRCSRALQMGLGISLEELILRQALGMQTRNIAPDPTPSGVMMIPVPGAGNLRRVVGMEEARQVASIEEVLITAHPGQEIVPLPEGSRYLGFIFARADTQREVDQALRKAQSLLTFEIDSSRVKLPLAISSSCG